MSDAAAGGGGYGAAVARQIGTYREAAARWAVDAELRREFGERAAWLDFAEQVIYCDPAEPAEPPEHEKLERLRGELAAQRLDVKAATAALVVVAQGHVHDLPQRVASLVRDRGVMGAVEQAAAELVAALRGRRAALLGELDVRGGAERQNLGEAG